jgi:hypothetical protein
VAHPLTWNLLQDDLLNLPGDQSGESLFGLVTRQEGPDWVVGTSYGIEVGLAGVLAVMMTVIGIWIWTARRTRQVRAMEERPGSGDAVA